ncbi:flagellar basal body rod protein FlgB [Legionella micdadei]|uniref:Flagellar basal body rod protein FlgB n=1 Tax=Legionella micdadei TaxID=451 RepID=A0A098GGK0_LEGMI|nr:flagellar basal body rod protein FlgB [Legionella micdadei]ARG97792.1 flagellar basal-body rod protein FlgB [Legionella micdadei]ARG99891.1 flagellar basal-body rod protein FlgB [Legionella micdadei]KTD28504.1 flagellar basal-body rod protein FlgB [Legionella micdadei]NSL18727.1 flagellar basal body rod protein FlgB [Legionella micdadei]CEG60606.1 Flagellar basal-body rod protein flgB [Legionella micdadei]
MAFNLDGYLGIHAKALMLREQRTSQLANNLANINTPNYKAKDIDFNEVLSQAMEGASAQQMVTDAANHISGQSTFQSQLMYRIPSHITLDGNTVDKDLETTAFASNAVGYQASLTFLNNKIKTMMTALKGE